VGTEGADAVATDGHLALMHDRRDINRNKGQGVTGDNCRYDSLRNHVFAKGRSRIYRGGSERAFPQQNSSESKTMIWFRSITSGHLAAADPARN